MFHSKPHARISPAPCLRVGRSAGLCVLPHPCPGGIRRSGRQNGRAFSLTGVLLSTMVAIAGCAAAEPAAPIPEAQQQPVVIAAVAGDAEQLVLGHLYAAGFEQRGREAEVVPVSDARQRLQLVRSGQVTMAFGCTGELLGLAHPQRALELDEQQSATTPAAEETADATSEIGPEVYEAFVHALPGEVAATDPGAAQGCADISVGNPGEDLPQQIVPFYLKPALLRDERVAVLNEVAGALSSSDLEELVKAVEAGVDPGELAAQWRQGV